MKDGTNHRPAKVKILSLGEKREAPFFGASEEITKWPRSRPE